MKKYTVCMKLKKGQKFIALGVIAIFSLIVFVVYSNGQFELPDKRDRLIFEMRDMSEEIKVAVSTEASDISDCAILSYGTNYCNRGCEYNASNYIAYSKSGTDEKVFELVDEYNKLDE